jgi:hypothetical protein
MPYVHIFLEVVGVCAITGGLGLFVFAVLSARNFDKPRNEHDDRSGE